MMPRFRGNVLKQKIKHIRWLFLVCALMPLAAAYGGDNVADILVVNSDQMVQKYQVVQDAFLQSVTLPAAVTDVSDPHQLAKTVSLLERGNIKLIYCIGSKAYQIGNQTAPKIPTVFSAIINWRRLPMNPNTFGISNELHSAMQMMLFRYVFPEIDSIGVLYSSQFNSQWFDSAALEAKKMGLELIGHKLRDSRRAEDLASGLLDKVDAYWLISDPVVIPDNKKLTSLLKLCDKKQIPVFTYNAVFLKYGATLAVSVDDPTVGRQAAQIAEMVLSGAGISEKIQFPAGSHIELNMRKVSDYGLVYSRDALSNINRIIE